MDKFQGGLINSYSKVTKKIDPSTHPPNENTDISEPTKLQLPNSRTNSWICTCMFATYVILKRLRLQQDLFLVHTFYALEINNNIIFLESFSFIFVHLFINDDVYIV